MTMHLIFVDLPTAGRQFRAQGGPEAVLERDAFDFICICMRVVCEFSRQTQRFSFCDAPRALRRAGPFGSTGRNRINMGSTPLA